VRYWLVWRNIAAEPSYMTHLSAEEREKGISCRDGRTGEVKVIILLINCKRSFV
jgi:hypothetical protein